MGLSKNEYDLLEQLISNLDDAQKKSITNLLNTKKEKLKSLKQKLLKYITQLKLRKNVLIATQNI